MCLANRACGTLLHPVLGGGQLRSPCTWVRFACLSQGRAAVARTSPPAMPEICLPLAGCSPKAGEPVQSRLLPASPAGMASHRTVPPGHHGVGGETQPFAGETSCLATGREPLVLAPCRDMPSTWQHVSPRMGMVLGTLVALGCPHRMVFICVRVGPPSLPSRGAWWRAALHGVRFWMARDSMAKRCSL